VSDSPLPAARHDHRDIGAPVVIGGLVAVLLGLGLIVASLLWLFPDIRTDHTIAPPLPSYPAPRLQSSPQAEWQDFHQQELVQLDALSWRDKSAGLVHLPVLDAMRVIATRGIPDWPREPQVQK
jgi:hypothetical protein